MFLAERYFNRGILYLLWRRRLFDRMQNGLNKAGWARADQPIAVAWQKLDVYVAKKLITSII